MLNAEKSKKSRLVGLVYLQKGKNSSEDLSSLNDLFIIL